MSDVPQLTTNLWKERWNALLEIYINPMEQHTSHDNDVTTTLLNDTVTAFKNFADDYIKFFVNGFFPDDANVSADDLRVLTPSRKFPPEYILTQILARVSEDAHLLRQIIDQRVVNTLPTTGRDKLQQLDALASHALQRGIDMGWVDPSTKVLTYFERLLSVRVIPYAHLAFVGVPVTGVYTPRDFLSIPHEVGHYFFNNGRVRYTPVENGIENEEGFHKVGYIWQWIGEILKLNAFKDYPWLRSWAEEIFADVYGCLIAGDSIALSAQILAQASSRGKQGENEDAPELLPSHIMRDDGEHPVPFFRPEIYVKTLERMRTRGAAQLRNRWQQVQQDYLDGHKEYPKLYRKYLKKVFGTDPLADSVASAVANGQVEETFASMADPVSKKLGEFVEALLDKMADTDFPWPQFTNLPEFAISGADDMAVAQNVFFDEVETILSAADATSAVATAPFEPIAWLQWCKDMLNIKRIAWPEKGTEWPFDAWFPVFQADGWTSDGPGPIPGVDPGGNRP